MNEMIKTPAAETAFATGPSAQSTMKAFTRETVTFHSPGKEARPCRSRINSAALRFIHRDDMEAEGYAAYLGQVDNVRR